MTMQVFAAKVVTFVEKLVSMFFSIFSYMLLSAECNWILCLVFTGSQTSPRKVLHHAGVTAMRVSKQMKKKAALLRKLYSKRQKPNLLLVGVFQLFEDGFQFGFYSKGSLSFRTCGTLQNLSQQL